ncbi:MAG: hypothetical protein FJ263_09200 [Planctomycetes bacterium]|nr:hypothetical protein [Planctomycetota bacterium]
MSEVTRRNIFDSIQVSRISWSGRLSETGFLSRLYDLESLPSFDYRHKTASGDIWQHREANPDDWSDDWLLTDSRFDLLRSSDEAFLQFLCETIHPIIRTEDQDVETLVKLYNKHLAPDGWEVVPKTYISGKPIFAARHRLVGGSPAIGTMKSIAASLDVNYITQQITRMEASVESDPELAIGTAKEFVETVCKTILREYGESISNNVDMPQLVKKVREKLDLLPDDIPEKAKGADTIKRVLSNLGAVAQGLAELRGLYGTGHGKDANVKGLHARHARLAVGAASALGVFLFETYKVRKGSM